MALTAGIDSPEEIRQGAVPRELGKLVDGGDHEGREQPIDFFVHGDDRYAFIWGVPRSEGTFTLISAEDKEPNET
jgi:hypothetical protein